MEVQVKQLVREQESNRVKGGWKTEIDMKVKGWNEYHALIYACACMIFIKRAMFHVFQPRTMISNAKAWATARGLTRMNEVHGQEEFKVPTEEEFEYLHLRRREGESSASFEVEDPDGSLLNFGDMSAKQTIELLSKSILSRSSLYIYIYYGLNRTLQFAISPGVVQVGGP